MKYIIPQEISVRSWIKAPYAYYIKNHPYAQRLSADEYNILLKCNGIDNIESSDTLNTLLARGLCLEAHDGETIKEWQIMQCNNRYVPTINWMLTGKCNYNCKHCFNAADNAPLMSEWNIEDAKRLIEEAYNCGVCSFTITGGEPMLHPHFLDIVDMIYANNMFINELNTNGFYITQDILDHMKSIDCHPLIKISFDGIGYHDWMRGHNGAEQNALNAIKLCIANGFKVMVQTNIWADNLDSILPTLDLLDSLGVTTARLIRTTETPRWQQNTQSSSVEIGAYYDAMLDIASQYIMKSHKMKLLIWQYLDIDPISRTYNIAAIGNSPTHYSDSCVICKGIRGLIAIAADGNVYPCHQASGMCISKGLYFGNVITDGLKNILTKGPWLDTVCLTLHDVKESDSKCSNCEFFTRCTGGCHAMGMLFSNSFLGADLTKCYFFENNYHDKITKKLSKYTNMTPQ